jgi:hypothetical protein
MMGQGGCIAMEDACVLAEELRTAVTVESALASYVSRRKPRVVWVQRQSMAVGESLTVPAAVRNPTLRERGDEAIQARFAPLVAAPKRGTRDSGQTGHRQQTYSPWRQSCRFGIGGSDLSRVSLGISYGNVSATVVLQGAHRP